MAAYYNENDPRMAAWLTELIKMKLIAPGEVDTRSIKDVQADEIKSFIQWHFFAGTGAWGYALRKAGWPDDRQVLTGSPPCQPWSTSGNQQGFEDPRHLWPDMFRLITKLQPGTVFGEQVASKESLYWWDVVAGDLEGADYAAAAIDMPAASVGAFHQRHRLFWVANKLGNADSKRQQEQRQPVSDGEKQLSAELPSNSSTVANTDGYSAICDFTSSSGQGDKANEGGDIPQSSGSPSTVGDDATWLLCRDGKLRATGAGINPLVGAARTTKPSAGQVADGTTAGMGHRSNQRITDVAEVQNTQEARMMRLKGYGNAIDVRVAIEFITTFMER
jgi:DNA (cytosine-5)-methyltransferase 1